MSPTCVSFGLYHSAIGAKHVSEILHVSTANVAHLQAAAVIPDKWFCRGALFVII